MTAFRPNRIPLKALLFALSVPGVPLAGDLNELPPEVDAFIRDRDLCDHFRGEPFEGESPEQLERRRFVFESLEIYCPGTDRRLAALKHRYRSDPAIIGRLEVYEERVEGDACLGHADEAPAPVAR